MYGFAFPDSCSTLWPVTRNCAASAAGKIPGRCRTNRLFREPSTSSHYAWSCPQFVHEALRVSGKLALAEFAAGHNQIWRGLGLKNPLILQAGGIELSGRG